VLGIAVLTLAVVALQHVERRPEHSGAIPRAPARTVTSPAVPTGAAPTGSRSGTSSASAGATPTGPSNPATTAVPSSPSSLPLLVLNNTTIAGLAERAAQRFRTDGWTVSVGNYTGEIATTSVYYDPAVATAHAQAEQLHARYPAVKQVLPKFAGLPAGPIVIVLAPDYS
jgi:hypothetical protein